MSQGKCHLCYGGLFNVPLIQLSGMPKAAQYYPSQDDFEDDKGICLNVYQCSSCGLVQLNIEPVEYYREVITATSFSEKTKLSRLEQMANFVGKFGIHGKKVLEIGCGKGNMLKLLEKAGLTPTGIEASAEFAAEGRASGMNVIHGYIGDMRQINGAPFDAFVSFNYLEHLPEPGKIIHKIYEETTPDAVGYVTVPNFEYLLKNKCLYEFVADHLSYFTIKTLVYTFEANGFNVLDCRLINDDNDIAAIVEKRKRLDISGHYAEVKELLKNLCEIVARYKSENKKVAVWGAGHRTLALLALGKISDIEYIVDSAKFKQGKFSPIMHTAIVSPSHLNKNKVDIIIVMVPGLYPDEVINTLNNMKLDIDIIVLKDNKIELV